MVSPRWLREAGEGREDEDMTDTTKIQLAIVRGIIERSDPGAFFGSRLSLAIHISSTEERGWLRSRGAGWDVTE